MPHLPNDMQQQNWNTVLDPSLVTPGSEGNKKKQPSNNNQNMDNLWMAAMCSGSILDCFCSKRSNQSKRLPRCSPIQAWIRRHNHPPLRWLVSSYQRRKGQNQYATRPSWRLRIPKLTAFLSSWIEIMIKILYYLSYIVNRIKPMYP